MGTPFDIVAGAAGLASLSVVLLQGCFNGFKLICTASGFEEDNSLIRSDIEMQQYKLFCWAEQTGLLSGQPDNKLNWLLMNKQLTSLEALLTRIDTYKNEYQIDAIVTEEEVPDQTPINSTSDMRRMVAWTKAFITSRTTDVKERSSLSLKKLKWSMMDKDGFSLLANDIRLRVDDLSQLLQTSEIRSIRDSVETLMFHIISQARDPGELNNVSHALEHGGIDRNIPRENAILTALRMKQNRIILGFEEATATMPQLATRQVAPSSMSVYNQSEAQAVAKVPRTRHISTRKPLSFRALQRDSTQTNDSREIAKYEDQRLIVEWKVVEEELEPKLKDRVKRLAMLLEQVKSSCFHSLNCCLGYLKDRATGWYGYVFQFPEPGLLKFVTLHDLLQDNERPLPALNQRLSLAVKLVETTLQLHTAGWLHKGIRPDNILLFSRSSAYQGITDPYLQGYEYARADSASEITELPAIHQHANLYRHPDTLRQKRRPPFCMAYDLFAIGCVLVEIGLWQTFSETLWQREQNLKIGSQYTSTILSPTSFQLQEMAEKRMSFLGETGTGSIFEALEFFAGPAFAGLVMSCLTAKEAVNLSEADEDDEDDEKCINLELSMLKLLRDIKV